MYFTLFFLKPQGMSFNWNMTWSMPWGVPLNWNTSSNWNQRADKKSTLSGLLDRQSEPLKRPEAIDERSEDKLVIVDPTLNDMRLAKSTLSDSSEVVSSSGVVVLQDNRDNILLKMLMVLPITLSLWNQLTMNKMSLRLSAQSNLN